jgi:hypothetical protein
MHLEKDIILIDKHNMILKKQANTYKVDYTIHNQHIHLTNLVNFNYIELICKLNSQIIERFQTTILDENNAECYFLLKHFFQDFGIPQYYTQMHIQKTYGEQSIIFSATPIFTQEPEKSAQVLPLPIDSVKIVVHIIDANTLHIYQEIIIDEAHETNDIIEKITTQMICKLFYKNKKYFEQLSNVLFPL